MINKSIQTQLVCYGIFITAFLALGAMNYNTKIPLFDAFFNSAKFYFFLIWILLLIPVAIILGHEFFSSEAKYEESMYNRTSIFVIQVSGLILYAILGSGVFVWFILNLSLISQTQLIVWCSLVITLIILSLIWLFFKKKFNFNILNVLNPKQFKAEIKSDKLIIEKDD